jgi:beta-galactosidase
MPIIREREISKDGPIIMVQACNEVGVGSWILGRGNYNSVFLDYFHRYLKEKYKNIEELNSVYLSKYDNFSQVEPPKFSAQSRGDLIRYYDWHGFHRRYYYLYIKFLYQAIRKRKITVPVFHNIPGWIFGRAYEYPVCASMYSEIAKLYPRVFLGVDHIPENPSFRNFHDDLIANQISRAIQGGKGPLMVVELQAGTREHSVRTYANELDLFYKACLAHGITGMNFYMFSQGLNPKRRGSTGPIFYWQTPLDLKAKEGPLYFRIKDLGQFVKEHGKRLINTELKSEVAVGFYRPYYQTEFLLPALGSSKLNLKDFRLEYEPKFLRDRILFDGILKILRILGYTYNILDLQLAKIKELLKFKQLWVASSDFMDRTTQKKLVNFVKSGGSLIILPTLPDKDLHFLDNKYMYEEFKIKKKKTIHPGCAKIDILKVEDLHCNYPINLYESTGAKTIARTPKGEVCGLRKRIGRGFVNLIGSAFTYESEGHLQAYEEVLKLDSIDREVTCDNPELTVVKRDGKDYAYLFVLNFHSIEKIGRVFYKNPLTRKQEVFPAKGNLCIHAHSGIIVYLEF